MLFKHLPRTSYDLIGHPYAKFGKINKRLRNY